MFNYSTALSFPSSDLSVIYNYRSTQTLSLAELFNFAHKEVAWRAWCILITCWMWLDVVTV